MNKHLEHDWFSEPLPENVQFGERSWLYSTYAFRHYRSHRPVGVRVGNDSGLYNGTFFDLGPDGEVQIGNFCTIVGAILNTNGRITIGDYVFIAHEVTLADNAQCVPPDFGHHRPATESLIRLGENVWIGARAIILAGADVGEGAIIGAGALVDFPVPPYSLVVGNPGRVVKTLRA